MAGLLLLAGGGFLDAFLDLCAYGFRPESPTRCSVSSTIVGFLPSCRLGLPRAASGRRKRQLWAARWAEAPEPDPLRRRGNLVRCVGEEGDSVALSRCEKNGHRKTISIRRKFHQTRGRTNESVPEVSRPSGRTDRFISERWTCLAVFSGSSVPFSGGSVPFSAPRGPPAAERLARIVVLCVPN